MKTLSLALKILVLAAALFPQKALAVDQTYEKTASTWSVAGVVCSTGTVIEITGSLSGYLLLNHRVQNQDSADAVWIAEDARISSSTAANLGERLDAGANGTWSVGYDNTRKAWGKLYCLAADAAGTAGALLSVAVFGHD